MCIKRTNLEFFQGDPGKRRSRTPGRPWSPVLDTGEEGEMVHCLNANNKTTELK